LGAARRKIVLKPICLLFGLYFLTGCAYKSITVNPFPDEGGIIVAGTYSPAWNSLLFFTSGIKMSFNKQKEVLIPWAEARFFKVPDGINTYEIWYNWFGQAGFDNGCFNAAKGQTLYMEYHPPTWGAFSDTIVQLSDQKTKIPLVIDHNCIVQQ